MNGRFLIDYNPSKDNNTIHKKLSENIHGQFLLFSNII